jgi:hypothetical protein
MRVGLISALTLVTALRAAALPQARATTVAIRLVVDSSGRADSALVVTSLRAGLEADSTLRVLERPPARGGRLEAARLMVVVTLRAESAMRTLVLSAFDVGTGAIEHQASLVARVEDLQRTCEKAGREIAAQHRLHPPASEQPGR